MNYIKVNLDDESIISYGLHINSIGDVSTDNETIDPCYIRSISLIHEETMGCVTTLKEYRFVYRETNVIGEM